MEIKIMLLLLFKLITCKENKKYDTNFYDKKLVFIFKLIRNRQLTQTIFPNNDNEN